jgi:cytochrome d ubiquinol oxidase subunit II
MTDIHTFLALVWYLLLGLILALYVITDGFDLGIGILSLLERDEGRRTAMMAAIGGVWDANETWLVLFGGALFGAFPEVYALALHALYIPVNLMLFGLVLRGVAFEFRAHARNKRVWNLAFGGGSLLAALAQGCALGGLIGGLPVAHDRFAGTAWSWLGVFPLVVAVGVAAGYALLGATYLVARTGAELQAGSRSRSRRAAWVTLTVAAVVTLVTPLSYPHVLQRWFAGSNLFAFAALPGIALWAFFRLMRSLDRGGEFAPFVWSIVIFAASLVGLAASLYPYLIPPAVTILEAASSSATLVFMLTGIGLLIPVMLAYNAYQYHVFRGKIASAERG